MWLFELIFMLIFGGLVVLLGLMIWKKQRIDLIHSYHTENVTEENKAAYAALMGKGMVIIGAGMILTGLLDFVLQNAWGWLAFGLCFIIGLALFIFAQRKYNR